MEGLPVSDVALLPTGELVRQLQNLSHRMKEMLVPGNSAWRRKEAEQGFDGDYSVYDMDGGDEDPRTTK